MRIHDNYGCKWAELDNNENEKTLEGTGFKVYHILGVAVQTGNIYRSFKGFPSDKDFVTYLKYLNSCCPDTWVYGPTNKP